ncbi:uncharacterized protein EV420DRAFT_1550563 [Desarmillaria tabescens]|uniref:Uncharacterized protein n=1 Tax=Armillaria tabescens TaxID=1929756 RepID=A0AA39KCK7_ARMTA|nr:uncharacterized protein EV420DRAFT_1550563 [Desarmillaria tabescens]KAK0457376.1 hypothetical protein EV420DRAFT_1550563 [Desarmillaria tabescens]
MSEEQILTAILNQALIGIFMHGIHTCIVVFALWAIFLSKEPRSKAQNTMVFLIICLFIFATIPVATDWVLVIYLCIGKGDSGFVQNLYHWAGIALCVNAGIADCITIWRCWIIWGCCWSVVILPILLFLAQEAGGSVALQSSLQYTTIGPKPLELKWTIVSLSCSLGNTLFCTTLIIYRILTVKQGTDRLNNSTSMRTYHRVIEILVESALLYAIGLIAYMVLIPLKAPMCFYPECFYVSTTAISPTLIVARVALGNARPNDSWQMGSNVPSLQFAPVVHSTSMNPDSVLTANENGVDLEHGRSEMTDNHEPESITMNTEKGAGEPEDRGIEDT